MGVGKRGGRYLGILRKVKYGGRHTLILQYEDEVRGRCGVTGYPVELDVEVKYRVSPGKSIPELMSLRRLLRTIVEDSMTVEDFASVLADILVEEGVDLLETRVYVDSDVHGPLEVKVLIEGKSMGE